MAPVGMISRMLAHIDTAQRLLVSAASGRHYAGKWSRDGARENAPQSGSRKTFDEHVNSYWANRNSSTRHGGYQVQ